MNRIQLFLLLIITFFSFQTSAQHLNNSLGEITSAKQIENGVELLTTNGNARVLVYSQTCVRISISKNKSFDDFSYAVISKSSKDKFLFKDEGNQYSLTTDSVKLIFTKKVVRFLFYNSKGVLLNEDEPAFGTSWIGEEVTTYKKMQDGERFIGLGEKTGNLDRRGEGYTNWNTDFFAYPSNGDPIYATIPFFMGVHHNAVYGLFMDNTYKSHFNFGASNNRFASFTAEDGDMNYYLFGNSNVEGIIRSYTELTGRMEMPSLWSIGFQQCRYSYYPDKEVLNLAKTFREKKIPSDVIYLDIHYMDQYKIFTWNKERFPQPKVMLDELEKEGFKTVVIVDPGIKVENGYKSYEEGLSKNLFLKYPDGTNYSGQVWPGWCHFPDFTKPETRKWWGNSFKGYITDGIDGFWNDMNEPATWGQKFPDLVQADFDGNISASKRWHNVYGMQMARSTFEGSKILLNGKRPFILTRAAYSGIQRYSAIWTGDNKPEDDHMMAGIRLVNSLGLSGVANAGYDVGGFAGDASKELFAKWIAIGSFCPFFRSHKMVDAKESEPWSYGEKVEEIARNYISLRYKLMPYLYSSFYEATQTGMPIARSLAINYTYDPMIYDWKYQNQYFFGQGIMVAPIVSYKEINKVYLPKGIWYNMFTEQSYSGNQELYVETPMEVLPVYIKGGSIIPMQTVVQSAMEKPADTLFLHVYRGDENNSFVYYEDAGDGYDYQNGKFFKRVISYNSKSNELIFEKSEGNFISKFNHIKLFMHGYIELKNLSVNGTSSSTKKETLELLGGISQFDPIGKSIDATKTEIQSVIFKNTVESVFVKW